ncbi:hypothetical protein ACOHOX_000196 [Cronobacter sakazakii]
MQKGHLPIDNSEKNAAFPAHVIGFSKIVSVAMAESIAAGRKEEGAGAITTQKAKGQHKAGL